MCLIGPTYPFRGGISHYTTLLYRNLKKIHEVYFFAFKRQYPGWLFPGATDKDSSSQPIQEEGAERLLDSLNPFTWVYVFWRIKRVDPELVILPWWVSFWTPQFWTITTLVKIFTRARILFLCHNVVEHESKPIDKLCTRIVLRKGDYFIVHSGEDLENLNALLPHANARQNFHPTYEVFLSGTISKQEAKKQLGIEGNIILFFGFVRPYKGLKYLIEAMPKILKHIDVTLLIVGEFWKGEEEYRKQIEDLKIQENIKIINKYLPNEEVGIYFSASDLVVQPYVSATGSGIVQTAFGCHRPVVSTNVGCLPEVIADKKTGYIVPPKDPEAIADAVVAFYKQEREQEFVKNIIQAQEKFSWARMVKTIESFQTFNKEF